MLIHKDSYFHVHYFKYLFSVILQKELDDVKRIWNSHSIRRYRTRPEVAAGRPVIMYTLPQAYGTQNYLQNTQDNSINICREECTFPIEPCDSDMFELCCDIMADNDWPVPKTVIEAKILYLQLRDIVNIIL